jgi:hypothetical protein
MARNARVEFPGALDHLLETGATRCFPFVPWLMT